MVMLPIALLELPEADLRKMYTRFRNIAVKRLKRIEESGLGGITPTFKAYRAKFKPLKSVKNKEELVYLISDIDLFLSRESSTVSGLRAINKRRTDALERMGFEVTARNRQQIYNFIDYLRRINRDNAFYNETKVREIIATYNARGDSEGMQSNALIQAYDKYLKEVINSRGVL